MPLPNIPRGGFREMPGPKPPERPQPSSKPEPPKEPPKSEDLSLFKKTQYVAPETLLDTLNKDSEFFTKAVGRSKSDAKKIKDTIGNLLPKGASITKDWVRRKALELDNAYQFPQSAPKDPNFPKNPKLNRKIREVFKKYFNV